MRRTVVALLVLALIVAALVYCYEDAYRLAASREAMVSWLSNQGRCSPILFILLQITQVIIAPIPGEVTGIVGGYLYGAFWGSLYSTIGLTIGSALAFALAHVLGEPLVERLVKKELLDKYDSFLQHRGLALAFVCFIIPGFPKDALCYVLGLSHIRWLPFLAVCTLGRLLGTTGLAISGALVRDLGDVHWEMLAALAAIVLLLFAIFLGRKHLLGGFHRLNKNEDPPKNEE